MKKKKNRLVSLPSFSTMLALVVSLNLLAVAAFGAEMTKALELFARQRYDESIEEFQTLLENADEKQAGEINFYIGRAYEMKNWWKKALPHFETIIEKHPDSPLLGEAMLEIGQCHWKMQKKAEAVAKFDEAERLTDDPWTKASALLFKGILLSSRDQRAVFDLEAAIADLKSVIEDYKFPDLTLRSRYWLGICYHAQAKYEDAINSWKKVVEEGPDSIWADFSTGFIVLALPHLTDSEQVEDIKKNFIESNQLSRARTQQVVRMNDAFGDVLNIVKVRPGPKDQTFKMYRTTNGKEIFLYFIKCDNFKLISDAEILFDGNVEVNDRGKRVTLQAMNVTVFADRNSMMANGNVNFKLRQENKDKEPEEKTVNNVDNLELDLLEPGNFSVNGGK